MHSHSFVEIAFAAGGHGTHNCLTGRRELRTGDVILLRPGVWHGYEDCRELKIYNCCFSSELLRRELAWTREDPLLGYLLWSGPYSSAGRGMLTISLDPPALANCLIHLDALAELRHRPPERHRGDIVGRLALLFSQLGQAILTSDRLPLGQPGPAHPTVGRAMRLLDAALARRWTLTDLADELHLTPGHLVRLFKAATGLPPMAYLAQLRAEHAAVLLLHSSEPITGATSYRKQFATGAAHMHHSGKPDSSAGRVG